LNDKNSYRFILGNLVVNNLCTITELSDCLGVNRKNIERYANTFRQKGAEYFFSRKETRGQCHKFTPDIQKKVQVRLHEGRSYYSIAREYGISEAAIRYHINKGTLKKKVL
jgi:biotin operon repressor